MSWSPERVTGSPFLFLADDDAELLQQARGVFKPLPKDMATAEFPVTPARSAWVACCSSIRAFRLMGPEAVCGAINPHSMAPMVCPSRSDYMTNILPRNAPTVFNAGLYTTQHWDGGFATVEDQAKHALLGPGFGNPDYATAMARVKAIPGLRSVIPTGIPRRIRTDHGRQLGQSHRRLRAHARLAVAV